MVALSGLLGVSVLWGHLPDLLWSGVDGNMMFPLLTGLFGLPSLLSSQRGRPIPEQHDPGPVIIESHVVLSGSLSGLLAGLVPGVTSTSATVPASMICGDVERDDEVSAERFIVLSATVGTAATVFGVLALASTGHGGTGALMVVESMLGGSAIEAMARPTSALLTLLLLSVLSSSLLAFVLTIKVGGIVARRSSGGSGARLSRAILTLTVALCAVLCGPAGLIVLMVATLVGSLPPALGVSRVCLTGCLILPIILSINGWRPGIEAFLGLMP
jgi:putative membrane protein